MMVEQACYARGGSRSARRRCSRLLSAAVWQTLPAFVRQCSGGEKQRALLARAVAAGSRIILLDEPTAHLIFVGKLSVCSYYRNCGTRGMY